MKTLLALLSERLADAAKDFAREDAAPLSARRVRLIRIPMLSESFADAPRDYA